MNEFTKIQNELKTAKQIKEKIDAVIKAKKLVQNIINTFKNLEKHVKKTKQSREAIKVMESFMKCNITNPVIFEKYEKVFKLLEKYKDVHKK